MIKDDVLTVYDKEGMITNLREFSKQIMYPYKIEGNILFKNIQNIVITGLGGSAIGGDLIRAMLQNTCPVPIFINRNYTLPAFVGKNTLVITASYSGNTEETISAFKQAKKSNAYICAITSGGWILKSCKSGKHPFIQIPGGMPPRAAIGYSLMSLIHLFQKLKLFPTSFDVNQVATFVDKKIREYSDSSKNNLAIQIALALHNKCIMIYANDNSLAPMATRWKGQLCENAKVLAFTNLFPELNHNEIVGWEEVKGKEDGMVLLLLKDKDDHKRNIIRMELTLEIIKEKTETVFEIQSEGKNIVERAFSLIILGDWISYYLAYIRKENPTTIRNIDILKENLQKII